MRSKKDEERGYMVIPGRYRHYKGQDYEVLGVARHSETEEEFVVYRALYGELWPLGQAGRHVRGAGRR